MAFGEEMMANQEDDPSSGRSYLEEELYALFRKDSYLFDFLQRGSLDGVWYLDLENPENEWMSPRFWHVLGYDPAGKEHLSAEWQNLIHPDDLRIALDNLEKHCQDPDHPYDQIVRYRHKDGSTVWVRCRGIAIRDENGKPLRMLGAHTDITPLKRTEEELRQKAEALEEANRKLAETIRGVLPICASCKKIRDEGGVWNPVESYIRDHSEADFTHGLCPDCTKRLYPGLEEEVL